MYAAACWFQAFVFRELIVKVQCSTQIFCLHIQQLIFALPSLWAPTGQEGTLKLALQYEGFVICRRICEAQILAQLSALQSPGGHSFSALNRNPKKKKSLKSLKMKGPYQLLSNPKAGSFQTSDQVAQVQLNFKLNRVSLLIGLSNASGYIFRFEIH